MSRLTFTSESVSEGHPDNDYISDAILDACFAQDPTRRVAGETLVKSDTVVIAGEITTNAQFDYEQVVRQAVKEIGYTLNLLRPIYRQSTNYGHFGRPGLPWEAVARKGEGG